MSEVDTTQMFANMLLATGVLIGSVVALVVTSVVVYRRTRTLEQKNGDVSSPRGEEA